MTATDDNVIELHPTDNCVACLAEDYGDGGSVATLATIATVKHIGIACVYDDMCPRHRGTVDGAVADMQMKDATE